MTGQHCIWYKTAAFVGLHNLTNKKFNLSFNDCDFVDTNLDTIFIWSYPMKTPANITVLLSAYRHNNVIIVEVLSQNIFLLPP